MGHHSKSSGRYGTFLRQNMSNYHHFFKALNRPNSQKKNVLFKISDLLNNFNNSKALYLGQSKFADTKWMVLPTWVSVGHYYGTVCSTRYLRINMIKPVHIDYGTNLCICAC
jgi:hypothetical protein